MSHFMDMLKGRVNTLPGNNPKGDNRKAGITWGQTIGRPECPYMKRWVLNFGLGSLRLHHWYKSDDPRALHDHPWWFLTFVLKGGYTDISDTGVPCRNLPHDNRWPTEYATVNGKCSRCDDSGVERAIDLLHVGSVRFRRALHAHTVEVHSGGCWTIMLTGPHSRDWGFWVDGTWKRMRAYFRDHDHHPCEE